MILVKLQTYKFFSRRTPAKIESSDVASVILSTWNGQIPKAGDNSFCFI